MPSLALRAGLRDRPYGALTTYVQGYVFTVKGGLAGRGSLSCRSIPSPLRGSMLTGFWFPGFRPGKPGLHPGLHSIAPYGAKEQKSRYSISRNFIESQQRYYLAKTVKPSLHKKANCPKHVRSSLRSTNHVRARIRVYCQGRACGPRAEWNPPGRATAHPGG